MAAEPERFDRILEMNLRLERLHLSEERGKEEQRARSPPDPHL